MNSRVRGAALLAAVVVLLAGCTGPDTSAAPSPSPTPSPTVASPSPTPTPTPTPMAEPTDAEVPATCDALVPLALVTDTLGDEWTATEKLRDPETALPGPSARAAAGGALETLSCQWFPSGTEGFLAMYAFELDEDVRDDLLESLRGASSYTPIEIEGADAFQTSEADEFWTVTTIYAFVDDVWIALHAPLYEVVATTFVEEAVANVQSASD